MNLTYLGPCYDSAYLSSAHSGEFEASSPALLEKEVNFQTTQFSWRINAPLYGIDAFSPLGFLASHEALLQ